MIIKRFVILSLLIIVGISGCKPANLETAIPTQEPIILGYCPTMKPYVQSLVESGQNLSAIQFDNSSRALQSLKAGTIQAALIGRIAWGNEVGEDIRFVRIKDGYTLITQNQAAIPYDALPNVRIFTLEENRDASAILPRGTSIIYYQDSDRMLAEMDGSTAVLLRWSEVPYLFQLLIPVDEGGNKIPEFRSPHFYYDETSEIDSTRFIEVLSSVD